MMRSSGEARTSYWPLVKLLFLCLSAATLAVAMTVLVAQYQSSDPSLMISSMDGLVDAEDHQPPAIATLAVSAEEDTVATMKQLEEVEKMNRTELLHLPANLTRPEKLQCDLFEGKWVEDESAEPPSYGNETCPFLSQKENCRANGRPDSGYLHWRWKPADCDLPRFDGLAFLELMRGKTLAFIGDSVTRNQYEALLCSLWQFDRPTNRGNRNFQRWVFRDYDFKVVRLWSSWLVHVSTEAIGFAPGNMTKLHLDTLDEKFAEYLPTFDVVVVATGHWWCKTAAYIVAGEVVGGQSWWNSSYGPKQHDALSGYGVAMKTALKSIIAHPDYKGVTILRTYSPEHYDGGAWNAGGSCTGKTRPLTDAELPNNTYMDTLYRHQMAAVAEARRSGRNVARLRVMDVTRPFSYRADGHPGPYRNNDPHKVVQRGPDGKPPPQDCLHWCMPGPIDTWNDYLFAMLKLEQL